MTISFLLRRSIGYLKRTEMVDIVGRLQHDPPYFIENHVKIDTRKMLMKTFVPTFKVIYLHSILLTVFLFMRILFDRSIDLNDPGLYVIPYLYHFWNRFI